MAECGMLSYFFGHLGSGVNSVAHDCGFIDANLGTFLEFIIAYSS